MNFSKEQLDMMKHAFGYDSENPGYRNYYCIKKDNPVMVSLVESGHFNGPHGEGGYGPGCAIFYLTKSARTFLMKLSLAAGKLRKNCVNCVHLDYIEHDEEAYSGHCCNKRLYETTDAESKHLKQLDNPTYRAIGKKCFEVAS